MMVYAPPSVHYRMPRGRARHDGMRRGRAGGQRGRSGGAAWRGWVMEVHGDSEYRVRGARHDGVRAAIGTLPRARAGARKKAGGMRLGRASGQRGRKQKPPKTQIVKSVATGRHGFFMPRAQKPEIVKSVATGRHGFFMPRNENNHSFRELRYVKESKTFAVFGNIVHIRGKRLSQISNMQNSVHFYNPKRTAAN